DGPRDLTVDHNTVIQTSSPLYTVTQIAGRWPGTGFNLIHNIANSTGGNWSAWLNTYFTGGFFGRDAMVGGAATNYPPDNFFPASLTQVGFVNLAAADYHLAPTSPYKNAGTDGKDLGADIDAVNSATADTVSGDPPGSTDTIPPTVAITAPTAGTTVAGTITVSASATDNVGVAGVQFKLDGATLGVEDTTAPYAVSWNTTAAADGTHTLTAVARDAAGNIAT